MEDSNADRAPERLRDLMMDDQAPHGANQAIKEAVKWEIEVVERKTEERFREIENLIKKVGAKMDKTASQL